MLLIAFLVYSGWLVARRKVSRSVPRENVATPESFVGKGAPAHGPQLTSNLGEAESLARFVGSTLLVPQEFAANGTITESEMKILSEVAWRYRTQFNLLAAHRLRIGREGIHPVAVYRLDQRTSRELQRQFYAELSTTVSPNFVKKLREAGATHTIDVAFDRWGYWTTRIRLESQHASNDQVVVDFVFGDNPSNHRISTMPRSVLLAKYGPIAHALLGI